MNVRLDHSPACDIIHKIPSKVFTEYTMTMMCTHRARTTQNHNPKKKEKKILHSLNSNANYFNLFHFAWYVRLIMANQFQNECIDTECGMKWINRLCAPLIRIYDSRCAWQPRVRVFFFFSNAFRYAFWFQFRFRLTLAFWLSWYFTGM